MEDLENHRLILFGDYRPPVPDIDRLSEAGRRPGSPHRGILEVNSLNGMLLAAKSGLGIAALPDCACTPRPTAWCRCCPT